MSVRKSDYGLFHSQTESRSSQTAKSIREIGQSYARLVAYFAVKHTAKLERRLLAGAPCVVAVRVPKDGRRFFASAAEYLVMEINGSLPNGTQAGVVDVRDLSEKSGLDTVHFRHLVRQNKSLLVVLDAETDLPKPMDLVIDRSLAMELPAARHAVAAVKILFGRRPSQSEVDFLLERPLEELDAAIRPTRSLAECIGRLKQTSISPLLEGTKVSQPMKLEDLAGYGAAAEWGMDLAVDLRDWKQGRISWVDVDRGLLLAGPPGTGKTMFAKALAATCGVELIHASLARWQAKGYLNDLLKAMRGTFETARSKAPCILFIDEFDAVGDRNRFSGHSAQYCTEVVNALLECLDGIEGREGVVVVGACNRPEAIDPALLRSGRLDRTITIGLPDAAARARILQHHIGDRWNNHDLEAIADVTEGWTGADLERAVRLGRRVARKSRAKLSPRLLAGVLPVRRPVSPELRYRFAVHEAGHALVGHLLAGLTPEVLSITADWSGKGAYEAGRVAFKPRDEVCTRQMILDDIATRLAGAAAEELIFGERCTGAGGGDGSDLQVATELAYSFHCQYAFGTTLAYEAGFYSRRPMVREAVERTLRDQFARTASFLSERRKLLKVVSDQLCQKTEISGETLIDLCNVSFELAENDVDGQNI